MAKTNTQLTHSGGPEVASPAYDRTPLKGKTSLRQLPWCGKINLRGEPHDTQFLDAVREVVGSRLPQQANHTAIGDQMLIFGLGPNEWMLHCELEHTATVLHNLQHNLIPTHHALTEVTDYYSMLELQGQYAIAALARGCPLDLHERSFPAKQCAQSRYGNASILLYKPDAAPLFTIQVRWSYAEYVWDYLASAINGLQDAEQ